MRYIVITLISCVISFVLEKLYLYFSSKNRTKEKEKSYYPRIWIVATIVFVCILILGLKVLCESNLEITKCEWFSHIKIFVSSGMHLVVLMLLSNWCINKLVNKQYKNNETAINKMENCIVVLYSVGIVIMGAFSWWYLSEIENFLMYIAILLGKFIWFDMKKASDTLSEIKNVFVCGFVELITKHKLMIVFECVIYALLCVGLYYMKYSDRINPIWDLNAVCLGVALSGVLLIHLAVLQDKRERQERKE